MSIRRDSDRFWERSAGTEDDGDTIGTHIAGITHGRAFTVLVRSETPSAGVNRILDWLVRYIYASISTTHRLSPSQGGCL